MPKTFVRWLLERNDSTRLSRYFLRRAIAKRSTTSNLDSDVVEDYKSLQRMLKKKRHLLTEEEARDLTHRCSELKATMIGTTRTTLVRERLYERITLEVDLAQGGRRCCYFVILLTCFVISMMVNNPINDIQQVGDSLKKHFSSEEAEAVDSIEDFWEYSELFANRVQEMMPGSSVYVQEPDYVSLHEPKTSFPPAIEVPMNRVPRLGGEWSLLLWMKYGTVPTQDIAKLIDGYGPCWMLLHGEARIGYHDQGRASVLSQPSQMPETMQTWLEQGGGYELNEWHHWAYMRSSGYPLDFSVYVDGELRWTQQFAQSNFTDCADGHILIGQGGDGEVAHVRFFPRLLEQREVVEVMQRGATLDQLVSGRTQHAQDQQEDQDDSDLQGTEMLRRINTSMREWQAEVIDEVRSIATGFERSALTSGDAGTDAMLQVDADNSSQLLAALQQQESCTDKLSESAVPGFSCLDAAKDSRVCDESPSARDLCPVACQMCPSENTTDSVESGLYPSWNFLQNISIFSEWRDVLVDASDEYGPRGWSSYHYCKDVAAWDSCFPGYGVVGPALYSCEDGPAPVTDVDACRASGPPPREKVHRRIEVSSPTFIMPPWAVVEIDFGHGGTGNSSRPEAPGFLGVAVKCDGFFVGAGRKNFSGQCLQATPGAPRWNCAIQWIDVSFFAGQSCSLHLIDDFAGAWGWLTVRRIELKPSATATPWDMIFDGARNVGSEGGLRASVDTALQQAVLAKSFTVSWLEKRSGSEGASVPFNYGQSVEFHSIGKPCMLFAPQRVQVMLEDASNRSIAAACPSMYSAVLESANAGTHMYVTLQVHNGEVAFFINGVLRCVKRLPSSFVTTSCYVDEVLIGGADFHGQLFHVKVYSGVPSMRLLQEHIYDLERQFLAGMPGPSIQPADVLKREVEIEPFNRRYVALVTPLIYQVRTDPQTIDCTPVDEAFRLNLLDGINKLCTASTQYCDTDGSAESGNFQCVDKGDKATTFDDFWDTNVYELGEGDRVFAEMLFTFQRSSEGVLNRIAPGVVLDKQSWLDIGTDKIVLLTLLYTPAQKMATVVRVKFTFSRVGVVTGEVDLDTLPDTNYPFLWTFFTVLAGLIAFLGLISSLVPVCKKGRVALGLRVLVDSVLCLSIMILCIVRLVEEAVSDSQEDLIADAVAIPWRSPDVPDMKKFERLLSASDSIIKRVQQREDLENLSYFAVVVSVMQMVHLFSHHPRTNLVVGTIQRIADDLIHFAFIFCATYLSLAWLAHITFGSGDERFRTYGQALITQFDFFMGSFPENVLDDDYKFAFYVMLYVFLVSILALNFLLAFIVEGYTSVVEYTRQLQVDRNIITDMFYEVAGNMRYWSYEWPSRRKVRRKLEQMEEDQHVDAVKLVKVGAFETEEEAERFLDFYAYMLGDDVLSYVGVATTPSGRAFDSSRPTQLEQTGRASVPEPASAVTVAPTVEASVDHDDNHHVIITST